MPGERDEQTYRLSDIDVEEVSLVDKPAIKRRFLVLKRDGESDDTDQAVADVLEKFDADSTEDGLFERLWGRITERLSKRQPDLADVPTDTPEDMPPIVKEETKMSKEEEKNTPEMVSKADMETAIAKATEESTEKATTAATAFNAELVKRDTEIATLRKEQQRERWDRHVTEKVWPGEKAENVTLIEKMAEHLPAEDFQAWLDREDTRFEQLQKAELFVEVGSAITKTGSATTQVTSAIEKARKENPEDPYSAMLAAVEEEGYSKAQLEASQAADRPTR